MERGGSRRAQKKLEAAVDEERREHPGARVEIWAMDEHRIGLKPIVRGIWAPVGERPIALGHHRFEWLYVTGFVEPATGRTVWNIANAVCKELFELILVDIAGSVGAGDDKRIVLQLDAGWHGPENLAVPDGIRLVFQPAHSPELQFPDPTPRRLPYSGSLILHCLAVGLRDEDEKPAPSPTWTTETGPRGFLRRHH
jgi:hypothetical protein